jgi:hypothetical protein
MCLIQQGLWLVVVCALAQFRSSVQSLSLDEQACAAFVALYESSGSNIDAVHEFRACYMPSEIHDNDLELYVSDLSLHPSGMMLGQHQVHEQTAALKFQRRVCREAQPCNPSFFSTGLMPELHWPPLWTIMDEYLAIASSQASTDSLEL